MHLKAILAQAQGQQAPGIGDLIRGPLIPMAIILIGFIFVTNRMQKKKVQEHDKKVSALKPGDKIVTSSGILATVVTVKEKAISIRSADSKLEITKAAVADILERSESSES